MVRYGARLVRHGARLVRHGARIWGLLRGCWKSWTGRWRMKNKLYGQLVGQNDIMNIDSSLLSHELLDSISSDH